MTRVTDECHCESNPDCQRVCEVSKEELMENPLRYLIQNDFVGVALAIFMGAIENTVAGTAMPTVIGSLGGIEYYSWVFSAYILAATVMTPIWGKMADVVGRRPAFIGGLSCFIVGSALAGASQSMSQLIAFRVLQGLGAAALFPIGMTIASDLLTLEQRAKFIGLFSGMWGVASLVGPLVGGYLATYLSVRWVFYLRFLLALQRELLSIPHIRRSTSARRTSRSIMSAQSRSHWRSRCCL